MKRQLASFGVASAVALSLTSPARALPDLVSSVPPSGWSFPALPRSSGDATTGSCALQSPALPGESSSTWFNGSMQNIGNTTASGVFTGLYLDDALMTLQGAYNLPANAFGLYVNYHTSLTLKGGRHTLLSRADVFGGVTEGNEGNNDWTRQYLWSPLVLTLNSPVTRSGDPHPYSTGSGPYMNCEGFQGTFTAGSWWYAFAVLGTDAGTDFDVTLHTETPSNVPQAGFGSYTAYSGRGGNVVDAVILDKNHAPLQDTYYAGVTEYSGSGNKVVQLSCSPFGYIYSDGVYGPFTLGAGSLVNMQEIQQYTSLPVSISIVPISGAANVDASLIGPRVGGMSRLTDCLPGGWAGSAPAGGTEEMVVTLQPDYQGLAVFKHDSNDLNASCTYDIVVTQLPNLVANHTPYGWSGPIVPRNDTNALPGGVVTVPPVLFGNQPTTSFNFSTYNASLLSSGGPWSTQTFVDDVANWFGWTPDLPGHIDGIWMNMAIGGPESVVRGGRHHLRQFSDVAFEVAESNETDNEFTDWFVWTPLDLADHTPVLRAAPPIALPYGYGPYESCDGFRDPGQVGSYWTAVAVLPTYMGSDYDVRVHDPSSGSKDGFGAWLGWSNDPFPGNPDFCIVNYNMAPGGPYDYSVLNNDYSFSPCYVQRADAPYYGGLPAGVSRYPLSLASGECLNMVEFYVGTTDPVYVTVNNVTGNADLELYIFDGAAQPYHTKGTYTAFTNANGPGGDEQIGPMVFPHPGYYAFVVAKSKATDAYVASTHELVFSTVGNLVDAPAVTQPLPREFALSSPRPNPCRGAMSVELAVPAGASRASVAVYDLAGRRVRSLVDGEVTPGRRVLTWDGLDSSGRHAAAGVYFVKLEAPHASATKKITLLR
ncbi:MAG: FlgD immunoglobulin-like domain containing protein [bacterium]